jgi:hypothetical protein
MTVWVTHLSTFVDGELDLCFDTIEDPEVTAACLAGVGAGLVTLGAIEGISSLIKGSSTPAGPPETGGPGGTSPVSQGSPITIQGGSPNLQGNQPSTPAPSPPSTPSPEPTPTPPSSTEGFFIEDDIYGGTWARTDPNNGTWYPKSTPPPNGAYWYPNGLGVAVSCAESAASYEVVIYGVHGTWSWWAHVTDGKWVPTVVFSTVWADGLPAGLSEC